MNIRVREAADYVGLSKSTMDKLRCFGGGPRYFKLGRAVVYAQTDLDEWLAGKGRYSTYGVANDNAELRAQRGAA